MVAALAPIRSDPLVELYRRNSSEDLAVSAARDSLHWFARRMFPGYQSAAHIEKLIDALEWAARTPGARLLVTLPPRHSKSLHVSELFPAWYLGNQPENRIIAASHSAHLAYTFSRRVRNLIADPRYPFPGVTVAGDKAAVQAWDIEGTRGGYIAVGVGGSPTGQGGDCLTADTRVLTYNGYVPIARLIQSGGVVLGFDHRLSRPVWKQIVAARIVRPKALYELVTKSGRRIRGTGEHRVFVEGCGYRPLRELRRGDVLVGVRSLWQDVHADAVRHCEGYSQGSVGTVLLPALRDRASERGRPDKVLPDLQLSCSQNTECLLFAGVRTGAIGAEASGAYAALSDVRNEIPAQYSQSDVLLTGLCESSALGADAWQEQFQLQRRDQLCQVVSGDASANSGARSSAMRCMRGAGNEDRWLLEGSASDPNESTHSSHQRGSFGQYAGQSNYTLCEVPSSPSCLESDTVAVVRHLRGGSEPVYDIQVEDCHNFFAEGVLVHNCVLIDDPLRSAADAESATIRESIWEWWQGTIRTRLEPGGSIILTSTRWHDEDLTGRLLAAETAGGEAWRHVHLPAIDDDGNALWPERWPLPELERIRTAIGSKAWNAQYQGSPQPAEGGTFKRAWWQRYRVLPESVDRAEITVDSAFKDGVANDYSVFALWARTDQHAYLVKVWRARVQFPELIQMGREAHAWAAQHLPGLSIPLVVEDNASGQSAIQVWQRNDAMPVIAYKIGAGVSKISRAEAVTPLVEGRRAFIPDMTPDNAEWLDAWLNEHDRFPNGAHDDQVDTTAMFLARMNQSPAVLGAVPPQLAQTLSDWFES